MAFRNEQDPLYSRDNFVPSKFIANELQGSFDMLTCPSSSHQIKVENRDELARLEARMIGTLLQDKEARSVMSKIRGNSNTGFDFWLNKILVTTALISHFATRKRVPSVRLASALEKAEHAIDFFIGQSPIICVPTEERNPFYYVPDDFDSRLWKPKNIYKARFLDKFQFASYWGCSTSYGIDPVLILVPKSHVDLTDNYVDLQRGLLY